MNVSLVMRSLVTALTALCATTLSAAYSNLIATSAGDAVYFEVTTGLVTQRWFSIRNTDSGRVVESATSALADVNGSGSVVASSSLGMRYCGFGGSTCFLSPTCAAHLEIRGPGIQISNFQRPTFVRLDRQGALVWIDQEEPCRGIGPLKVEPSLNGLYDTASLRQVAPANGAKLANQRSGRRVLDDRGQALVFVGNQLSWLDATGVRAIRHVAGAFEAVIDSAGANIVYVEGPFGKLHWIAAGDDQELGLAGSAPALSEDGRTLVFLAADDSLQVYDRLTRAVRRLTADTYTTFSLGGNAAFAVTRDNRLVRIDLLPGQQTTWLQPFPEIKSADAPPLGIAFLCPFVCYGTPDLGLTLGRGMLLVLRGRFLDQPGWRARSAGVDFPLHVLSDTAAWVQIPRDLARTDVTQAFEVYHPEHPIVFSETAQVQNRVVTCFGALHQDFSRIVTPRDPAEIGEIVHIFFTGLHGVESIPDNTPNPLDHLVGIADPPTFADPQAMDVLFLGLAPGLIALQQLDVRIRAAATTQLLWSDVGAFECAPPPIGIRQSRK